MRAMMLALGLWVGTAWAENPEIKHFPEMKIGTNSYRGVAIKKRNEVEAIVRFESGVALVKIAELPEPVRSEWLDRAAAAAYESKKTGEARAALARIEGEEKEAQRNGVGVAEFYGRNISEKKALADAQSKKTQALLKPHSMSGSPDDESLTDAALEGSLVAEEQLQENLKIWQLRASAVLGATGKPAAPSRPKAPSNLRIQ